MTLDWKPLLSAFAALISVSVVILIISVYFLIAMRASSAHDHDRPDLDKWFNELSSGKGVCCSDRDGTVLTGSDWESKDGHYRVRLQRKNEEGVPFEWVDVPPEAVITVPNLDGHTMVWPIYGYLGVSVRCFLPGAMT